MKPVAIVGDLHGDLAALRRMLSRLEGSIRPVVFVGDYINGADQSSAVIDELCERKAAEPLRWRFLAGNHDLALLDYLRGGDFAAFARLGGVSTLSSYLSDVHGDVRAAFRSKFPERHRRFLEALRPYYEDDDLLVSHAGFAPERPADRSFEALARSGNRRVFQLVGPRELVVCGHYLQKNGKPHVTDHFICLDTGCGVAGGPLTAVLLPERKFLSVDSSPEISHESYLVRCGD
jgi:Calcineurin-like phosphoesterase